MGLSYHFSRGGGKYTNLEELGIMAVYWFAGRAVDDSHRLYGQGGP